MRFVPLTLLILASVGVGQDPSGLAAVLPKLDPKASKDDRLAAVQWVRSHANAKDAADAIPALERLVRSDPVQDVRVQAVAVLAQIAIRNKRPCPLALVEAIRDKVDDVRWEAMNWADAIDKGFAPGSVEVLLAAAGDERAEVRTTSLNLLGQTRSKDPKVLAAIDKAKADPSFDVRHSAYTARYALTRDLPEALRYQVRLLADPDELLKPLPADEEQRQRDKFARNMILLNGAMSVMQWAEDRPDDLAKALLDLLDDKSPLLRLAAAHLVGAVAQAPRRSLVDVATGPDASTQFLDYLQPYLDPTAEPDRGSKADKLAPPRPAKVSVSFRALKVDARLRKLAADDPNNAVREMAAKSLKRLAETPELLAVPPRVVR